MAKEKPEREKKEEENARGRRMGWVKCRWLGVIHSGAEPRVYFRNYFRHDSNCEKLSKKGSNSKKFGRRSVLVWFLFFLLSGRHRQAAMASNGSGSTVSPATPLLSLDRARYRPTLAGSFAFPYDLSWDLTGSCWEFLLLLALASSGPQVVGEMQSSLDRVRRQLSSTSTRHLLQGPLLKRSDTVNPLPSFPFLSGFPVWYRFPVSMSIEITAVNS